MNMHSLFELNPNILETNLINIILLIALLLYANKVSFSSTLKERQININKDIEKAEKDVSLALKFYKKSEENLKLNSLYLYEWKGKYENEKQKIVKTQYDNIKQNLSQIFSTTESLFESFERKKLANLEKYLILFTVGKLLRKFFFLSKEKKAKIVKEIIHNFEEELD